MASLNSGTGICNSKVQRFFFYVIGSILLSRLSDLCPEDSSKIGGQFGLARLKAFGIDLNSARQRCGLSSSNRRWIGENSDEHDRNMMMFQQHLAVAVIISLK